MNKVKKLGILLFNEAEVLDFSGPFEVFAICSKENSDERFFEVCTIAENSQIIRATDGLMVQPQYDFSNAPELDILIVPGGTGAEEIEIHNQRLLDWIRQQSEKVELLASVCTGAFLLAEAGLLKGRRATTHWMYLDRLEREYPSITVERNTRYVDLGSIITSAGISAGIDMSLYIAGRYFGRDTAEYTAKRMEYDWRY